MADRREGSMTGTHVGRRPIALMNTKPRARHELTGHRLVARRTRRYVEALRWIVGSVLKIDRIRVIAVILLITAGRIIQVAAFSLVFWFFVAVEKGEPIVVLDRSFDPRAIQTISLAVGGVMVILLIASVTIFISVRMSFKVSMDFAEHTIRRTMELEGGWPARAALTGDGTMSAQAQGITTGKVQLFRPVSMLLAIPRQLLLALPAIGGMIWIAGEAVAYLVLLAVPAIVLNYRISRSVVVAERTRRKAQRAFRSESKAELKRLGDESKMQLDRETIAGNIVNGSANQKINASFGVRILSGARSELVSNVTAAVAIATIGLYLGYEAVSGNLPLTKLVAFFFLLRFAVGGLGGIASSLTTYARFYEMVRSTYEYLTSANTKAPKLTGRLVLHVRPDDTGPESPSYPDVPVRRGKPVAVLSPAVLNRYTQYFFAHALMQKSREPARATLNARSIRCTEACAEPESLQRRGLPALDQSELDRRTAGTPIAEYAPKATTIRAAVEDPDGIRPRDRARLALLSAFLSKADLVIMEPRLVTRLLEPERSAWLSALSDRYLALAYRYDGFTACLAGESHAIMMDYERAVAIAPAAEAAEVAANVAAAMTPPNEPTEFEDDM
jgi:hypothetical protein